jgi:flagella basal body P-ring formation protein FlgA
MKYLLILLVAASSFAASTPEAALEKAVLKALGHAARVEVRKVSLNRPWPEKAEARLLNPDHPYGLVAFEGGGVGGTAEVRAMAKVVVASTPITDGEAFTSSNTRLEERELTRVAGGGYHTSLQTLSSMRARGRVPSGAVVGIRQTQAPVLVQPGQMVDLVVERGGLKVKARVEALQRGRNQEWIRVRNSTTRKVLQAKVVDESTVTL